MKIGFIGAGKVGFSLGKYFATKGANIRGYYSKNPYSAQKAADFTSTKHYVNLQEVVSDNDVLFLTVPDNEISPVWNSLKPLNELNNKIICHCSGVHSSHMFSDAEKLSVFGFSLHPIFAFHDKYESWKALNHAIFSIEGNPDKITQLTTLIESMGNQVNQISPHSKATYHAATVIASNHMVALTQLAINLLVSCGFSHKSALYTLSPLMESTLRNINAVGTVEAMTGPIERNDLQTIKMHLDYLDPQTKSIYQTLSQTLVTLAKEKHEDRNYAVMEALFT